MTDQQSPRTTVTQRGEFDEIELDGAASGSLAIDYSTDPPRAILQVESLDDIQETHSEGAYINVAAQLLSEDQLRALVEDDA